MFSPHNNVAFVVTSDNKEHTMAGYEMEDLMKDMQVLMDLNLIEVVGINDAGEFLYGPTEHAKQLSESEIVDLINKSLNDDEF